MRRILVVLSLGLVAGCADMQVKETDEAPTRVRPGLSRRWRFFSNCEGAP